MYVNNDLTDYISSKLYETSYLILNSDPIFAYITILYIASSDYRPKHWNNLKKHLEETEIFEKRGKKELLWLKAACSLIALDIYKPDILKKALNTELSPKHFRRSNVNLFSKVLFNLIIYFRSCARYGKFIVGNIGYFSVTSRI